MSRVTDNTEQQRFELEVEGHLSFIDYRRHGQVITMTHAFRTGARCVGTGARPQRNRVAALFVRCRLHQTASRVSSAAGSVGAGL
jgi:hypothetical protein